MKLDEIKQPGVFLLAGPPIQLGFAFFESGKLRRVTFNLTADFASELAAGLHRCLAAGRLPMPESAEDSTFIGWRSLN